MFKYKVDDYLENSGNKDFVYKVEEVRVSYICSAVRKADMSNQGGKYSLAESTGVKLWEAPKEVEINGVLYREVKK